jgi:hypothetical protein
LAWWLKGGFHYPDEIFQQVEPAHYLRTGVAWLPWEFEAGVRSWVLPGVYAAQLELLSWFGVSGLSALRALTLHNAIFTVLIVPAGYRIGAALYPEDDPDAETAGLAVAFFMAALPALVYYAPHTLIGTPCMVLLTWGYAYWLEARRDDAADAHALLRCGFFFGAAGALRFVSGFHMLVPLVDLAWRGRSRAVGFLLLGSAFPVLFAGSVDLLTWGLPFHSTIEHLSYNFFKGGASNHGREPWIYYITQSLWGRFGPMAPLAWGVVVAGLRRSWPLVLTLAVPSAVLSFIPHKEDRFLMFNWPLLAGALGIGGFAIARALTRRTKRFGPALAAAIAVAVLVSNGYGTRELPWTLRRGLFRAQSFVGGLEDASGLLLEGRQFMNGGYLVFDRTVPQVEFSEVLSSNSLYNYAALRRNGRDERRLRKKGWRQVESFGEFTVLKRPD